MSLDKERANNVADVDGYMMHPESTHTTFPQKSKRQNDTDLSGTKKYINSNVKW